MPEASTTGITPTLKRNSATAAAIPMTAEAHSNRPERPCGHSTWYAKKTARLTITPTTAAVMPTSGAVNFKLPCVDSMKGPPSRMKKNDGKKVLVAACDTFRAAAVEQLTIWADRIGVDIVKQQQGSDPAAVAHDACERAKARQYDVLIVDTAGRLHTQTNLMRELEKIHRIVSKQIPGAPHEVLLVLDATTGQNAITQAEQFTKTVKCTGLILTKLDGTAKGGAVFGIKSKVGLPVKFIGVGEQMEDLEPFNADEFVAALFEE